MKKRDWNVIGFLILLNVIGFRRFELIPPLVLDARTAPMGLAMAVYHRNKMKPATRASLSQTGASGGFILLGR